jgi:hypothetical protein
LVCLGVEFDHEVIRVQRIHAMLSSCHVSHG